MTVTHHCLALDPNHGEECQWRCCGFLVEGGEGKAEATKAEAAVVADHVTARKEVGDNRFGQSSEEEGHVWCCCDMEDGVMTLPSCWACSVSLASVTPKLLRARRGLFIMASVAFSSTDCF